MNALRAGNPAGKTIVFVHAASLSAEMWLDQLEESALQLYNLVAVDIKGHGRSERSTEPDKDYTLSALGKDLAHFVSGLASDYVIVGMSLGTNLIAEAVPQLDKCKGVMLISPSIAGGTMTPDKFLIPFPASHVMFTDSPTNEEFEAYLHAAVGDLPEKYHHYARRAYFETDPALRKYLGMNLGSGGWADEIENLKALRPPICIVQGSAEQFVRCGYLEQAGFNLWRKKIYYIGNAAHLVHWHRRDVVNKLIADYADEMFGEQS